MRAIQVGDFVRDRAGLGGTVARLGSGQVFVIWNNGARGWINIDHVRV